MKFGLGINTDETTFEIVQKCILAERLGVDYVWVSDAPVHLFAPAVVAAVAENTRKIRIGVGLMSAFLHSPRQIVHSLVTLIETYGERFELCVGPGDRNMLKSVGVSARHPAGIKHFFEDTRRQMRTLLGKQGIDFRLWLGAQGPIMLETAGFYDGVMLNYAHPDHIKWAIERIKPIRPRGFQFGIYAPSYVYSEFDPEIHRLLRISSAVVALGASDAVLKRLDLSGLVAESKRKFSEGAPLRAVVDGVPTKAMDLFSISKSTGELGSYLAELSLLGVQHVVFSYPQNHDETTIQDLAAALKGWARHKSR